MFVAKLFTLLLTISSLESRSVFVVSNPVEHMVDLRNALGDLQNKTIERLGRSDVIPDLPSPFRINDTTLNIDSDNIKGSLAISNAVATGLDKLVDDININLVTSKVTMSFKAPNSVHISGDYVLDGSLAVDSEEESLSVSGNGPFSFSISNMNLAAEGKLAVNLISGKVAVKDIELQVAYDSVTTNAENFAINGESVDWESFNTDLNENFDSIWNTANEPIALAFTEALNEALAGYAWAEIIDLISGKPTEATGSSDDSKKVVKL